MFSITLTQQLLFLQGSVVLVIFIEMLITSIGATNENQIHVIELYVILLPSVNGSLMLLCCPFHPLTVYV